VTIRRVSKNLQQGRSSREDIGYRGDSTGQKSQETQYNLNPATFFVQCIWGRRPDGIAINQALQIVYMLEFKQSACNRQGQGVPTGDRQWGKKTYYMPVEGQLMN